MALYSHAAVRNDGELFAPILASRGLPGVAASTRMTQVVLLAGVDVQDVINAAMSRLMLPQYGGQMIAMVLGAQFAQYAGDWPSRRGLSSCASSGVFYQRASRCPFRARCRC